MAAVPEGESELSLFGGESEEPLPENHEALDKRWLA